VEARHEEILKAVRDGSTPTRVFWLMNALATVIACYGLLANSAAVVIGAMVVAMLLGPISGVALGLNYNDHSLLKTSLWTLSGGVIWILAIATGVGLIHRDVPLTAEILSRTNANLFDLIIALAGGAAGAVAVLSPRVGTAIVGVALATALVPPLAAAGLLAARGDLAMAGGALVLALTNVVAIQVAFSVVFWVGGYRWLTSGSGQSIGSFLRRNIVGVALISLLAIVLAIQFQGVISNSLFESQVRTVLSRYLSGSSGFRVVSVDVSKVGRDTMVRAVVRGPKQPSSADVAAAQAHLPMAPDGRPVRLRVRFVQIAIITPQGLILDDEGDDHESESAR
jgi:uncharacterized hydrophobic protein (TIGR00271 family)